MSTLTLCSAVESKSFRMCKIFAKDAKQENSNYLNLEKKLSRAASLF